MGKNGGARPGAGRKSKAEEAGLQKLLDECWTQADRRATLKQLADQSKKGNLKATELLMAYTYGRPKEQVEMTGSVTVIINGSKWTPN